MIAVYLAADIPEAQLLCHRLAERGIKATVRNTHLQGALGELPLSVRPEVCIERPEDFEEARRAVGEMEAARRAPDEPDVICEECGESNPGNFELCWSCGGELGKP